MNYKEVELTTGRTVKVYAPPVLRISRMLDEKYPEPQKPIVTETTGPGRAISMIIEDDPEYKRKMEEREIDIDKESGELNILFALLDEQPPDDFSMDFYLDILSYSNPDLKARDGKNGRKLDWIEWDLLSNPADETRVAQAINSLISVDMEVVDSIGKSFPDQVEG